MPAEDERDRARSIIERAIGARPGSLGQNEPTRRTSRRQRQNPDRVANLAIGTLFLVVGCAALAFFAMVLWPARNTPGFLLVVAMVLPIFGGIAVVGLNMVIQGARNRPGAEGFFYRALPRLTRLVTPLRATAVPLCVCAIVVVQGLALRDTAATTLGVTFALVWSSAFLQLLLHEVGHLVAVERVRFRFVRLAAGPVTLVPRQNGYHLGVNRKWLHLVIDAVFYEFDARPTSKQKLVVAAAGPIATAIIGLLALAAKDAYAAERGSIVYAVASANANIAGALLVVNLLPFRLGTMESDGLQIWNALSARRGT